MLSNIEVEQHVSVRIRRKIEAECAAELHPSCEDRFRDRRIVGGLFGPALGRRLIALLIFPHMLPFMPFRPIAREHSGLATSGKLSESYANEN